MSLKVVLNSSLCKCTGCRNGDVLQSVGRLFIDQTKKLSDGGLWHTYFADINFYVC